MRALDEHTSAAQGAPRLVEALVSLHNSLKQPEAALGVLHTAQQRHGLQVKLTWLEKLGQWQNALQAYDSARLADPRSSEYTMGRLRCLSALSEWSMLARVAEQAHPSPNFEDPISRCLRDLIWRPRAHRRGRSSRARSSSRRRPWSRRPTGTAASGGRWAA